MYRAITITRGSAGWGGPLTIKPTEKCYKVISVTGGGIHPVAAKIAEMTGGEAVDGFSTGVPDDEVMIAVVDCGGTARCGVYPKKKIFTVNLTAVGKSGPLAKFITEDLYVSDVTENCLKYADENKTMVEMTAMSNATGLVPDVIGGHGPAASPAERCKELNEIFKLKEDGGILNKHGVVEYVNGIAPGVFVTVSTENEEIAYQMQYHSMGPGPLWTLYRPYHLCNLETPLTVAKAVIDKEPTIIPIDGPVSECITVAKRDLKAGEYIDGIGGYTTYGSIATSKETYEKGYVLYGLVNKKARMLKDAKKGQLLTLDMVELDTSTQLYHVRKEQDAMYGKK